MEYSDDEFLRDSDGSSTVVVEEEEESSTEYSSDDEVEEVMVVEPVATMPDEEPEKSKEEIAAWVAYKAPERMQNYLAYEMNKGTPLRHWDQFLDSLTTLALAKDDPEEFVQLHDVCYRWMLVTSKPMPVNTWLNYKTNRNQKKKPPPSDGAQKDSKLPAVDSVSVRAADSSAVSASEVASAPAAASEIASAAAEAGAASTAASAPTAAVFAAVAPATASGSASASVEAVAASTAAPAASASAAVASDAASFSVSGDASVQGSAVASSAASPNFAASNSKQIRKKLPKDSKFLLEIKTHHQRWKPWISLQPSTIKGAGIGVFAERQFDANAAIGFYVGKALWKSKYQGYSKPSDEYFNKELKFDITPYDLAYNDLDCKYRLRNSLINKR